MLFMSVPLLPILYSSSQPQDNRTLFYWDNPRKVGILVNESNEDSYYAGPNLGYRRFLSHDALWSGSFLKGGDVYFLVNFYGRHHNMLS